MPKINRDKEPEIVLASLRGFACVPKIVMTNGLNSLFPLTVHVPTAA